MFDGYADFLKQNAKQATLDGANSASRKGKHTATSSVKSRCSSPALSAKLDCCTGKLVKEIEHAEDNEFDLNVSFSGGYIQNTDLNRVDKGQGNPQFKIGSLN